MRRLPGLAASLLLAACAFAADAANITISPKTDSTLCIDTGSGAALLAPCNASKGQLLNADGGYLGVDTKCLSVAGAGQPLKFDTCDADRPFYWAFDQMDELSNETQFCADLADGKVAAGTPLIATRCEDSKSQHWEPAIVKGN